MSKQIPLISSGSAGPLGVLHLPRLWQKLSLGATNQLDPDWDLCGAGFDGMTLGALGIDRAKAIAHVVEHRPSYAEFEAWVKENAAPGKLSKENIDAHNAAVRGYHHGDSTRHAILSGAGFSDDGSIKDAVRLNEIEDWNAFHAAVIKNA